MADPVTRAEYARRRGVSRMAVTKAVQSGRITLTAEGLLDPDVADAQWAANTDPAQALKATGRLPDDPDDVSGGDEVKSARFTDARARREEVLADIAELDLAERRGELIHRDSVRKALVSKVAIVRESLDNMADRLAPLLAAEGDIGKIRALLRGELRHTLGELSRAGGDRL